jgi:hypothetical protein
MTEGQLLAVDQLHAVETAGGGVLQVLAVAHAGSGNEWVRVEVSIACGYHQVSAGGLALEAREPFIILIPPGFPFRRPELWTEHTRFAGHPHVQWGRYLCLYQAPSAEWDPSDGMYGFLERLESWLDHASRGELDPVGAPLHPPVTYAIPGVARRAVVVRADAPPVTAEPWIGYAQLNVISGSRLDLTGWSEWSAAPPPDNAAAAVLLLMRCHSSSRRPSGHSRTTFRLEAFRCDGCSRS